MYSAEIGIHEVLGALPATASSKSPVITEFILKNNSAQLKASDKSYFQQAEYPFEYDPSQLRRLTENVHTC